ncbi:hypothetical protein LCGC14_1222660 [marine sediment metagenome]|uniref:Uncharacterized protein n=1 Tax=marine sediment metagenome TaxID=412755 RepID=A0A0F9LAW9_9ZZZZ|nr:hypothetical protein [bacterium]
MIIIKCDICKEEIKLDELSSTFKYVEKTQLFVEARTEAQIQEFNQVFCEKCTDEIKKKRDEMVKQ